MEFSRQYLTRLAQESNFIKDTLEKVLRLSEILKFLNSDVVFKDKLALKGGTAINLTAVELPRLSVDIDLDFTVKSKSMSTDRRGSSTAVKLIAVPPLSASLSLKTTSLFKNFNISERRKTFSKVSFIKLDSWASLVKYCLENSINIPRLDEI